MRTRPRNLAYLAFFLIALAFSFPLQVMALHGHGPTELGAIAAKLAPLNWVIMAVSPVVGWLAFRASSWLLAGLPVLAALVIYNNWLVAAHGDDYGGWVSWFASAVFVLGVGALVRSDALAAILNPGRRWWRTPARHRIALPIRVKLMVRGKTLRRSEPDFDEFQVKTFDLSEGGLFIPLDQPGQSMGGNEARKLQIFGTVLKNLAVGTQCYVSLPLRDVSFLQCRAEVVRNTPARGEYPAGVGVRFLGLTRGERRRLVQALEA